MKENKKVNNQKSKKNISDLIVVLGQGQKWPRGARKCYFVTLKVIFGDGQKCGNLRFSKRSSEVVRMSLKTSSGRGGPKKSWIWPKIWS